MVKIAQDSENHKESSLFNNLVEPLGVFDRAMCLMELLANSGHGLGEVLRDYAGQTYEQMNDLYHVSHKLGRQALNVRDAEILRGCYCVLTQAASVLDMIPAAMQRNHAEYIGVAAREKIAREEVVRIARAFRQSPEVHQLIQSEDQALAMVQKALDAASNSGQLPLLSTALAPRVELRG